MRGKDPKAYFALLQARKEDIHLDMGEPLTWEELPERIGSRIALYKKHVDPTDEADWPNQHAWMADALARLDRALRPRVRALDIDEIEEPAEAAE